ncbi:efflux RND transporter periplasmic adaptor subunit [Caulobacter sp. 17J80-11]|uniref:efflux RND transporter periplasmic adaptor subunit n=1 Tax=Caulobacter sp. 17J80-11 TaxID=2763502 RepID=UPI001653AE37|nr:efflux RND transporter periplasmic adaptor subunit [Caulobacter sp. 17J80-11]MBC6982728.1 efflux RND transporter periplasmic adaptor subunit [Caulobacter sp. 17J80-11]
MFKRHFFLVAAIAVVLTMGVAGGMKLAFGRDKGGPGGGGGGGGRGAQITQYVVAPRPFVDRVEVLGQAKARESITVTAPTSDLIAAVHFRPGQSVAKGAVLVELVTRQQDADVMQAQATADLAEAEYKRWQTLADKGIAPRATAEQRKAEWQRAKAAVVAQNSRKLDRVIRAPFAGTVGLSDTAPGMLVSPGTPIVTLDDLSVIKVDFQVPERYLPILQVGAPIQATADALPGVTLNGRVAVLDTRVDPATRALTARAEFANADGRIKPGMLIRVGLDHGSRTALAAPESAVQFEADTAFVMKITPQGEKTVAQRVVVLPGSREGGFIEIRDGLMAGDKIVADGLNRVQPNQPVRLAGAKGGEGGHGSGKGGSKQGAAR